MGTCVFCVCVIYRPVAGVAAGASWATRTASALWAARASHTSVIDAAGAIYVIGGDGAKCSNDVWVSTDGGARPDFRGIGGGGRRVLEG
jgi:hypothetical protein